MSNNITSSTKTILANMGYYFIFIVSFFAALKSIGLDFSSLTIIAGALSVGIGFGLQNIVSNLISGIILMFEKSIKIGDYIEIDSELRVLYDNNIEIPFPQMDLHVKDSCSIVPKEKKF